MSNSIRHTFGLMAAPALLAPVICAHAALGKPRLKPNRKHTSPATEAPRDHFDDNAPDSIRITHRAGAVYVANQLHDQARTTNNPAKTLDDIADALPEVMPNVFRDMGTAPDLAAALLPDVTDRVWAYSAVEHARIESGDGYGYHDETEIRMPQKPSLPYGHVALPADLLATALYGLGQYEAVEIEGRGDGLRPSISTCKVVAWLWENGRQGEATNVVGTVCAVLRGRPVPGGTIRITHGAVIDALGAELAHLGMTPEGGWAPISKHLYSEVPSGF